MSSVNKATHPCVSYFPDLRSSVSASLSKTLQNLPTYLALRAASGRATYLPTYLQFDEILIDRGLRPRNLPTYLALRAASGRAKQRCPAQKVFARKIIKSRTCIGAGSVAAQLAMAVSAELQLRVVKRWRWRRRPPASVSVRTAQRSEQNRALRCRSAVLRAWSASVNARLAL